MPFIVLLNVRNDAAENTINSPDAPSKVSADWIE